MKTITLTSIDVLKCTPTKNGNLGIHYLINGAYGEDAKLINIDLSENDAKILKNMLNEHLGNKKVYVYNGQYTVTDEGCVVKLINNMGDEVNIGKSAIKELYEDYLKNTDNKKEPIELDNLRIKSVEKEAISYLTIKTHNGDVVQINEDVTACHLDGTFIIAKMKSTNKRWLVIEHVDENGDIEDLYFNYENFKKIYQDLKAIFEKEKNKMAVWDKLNKINADELKKDIAEAKDGGNFEELPAGKYEVTIENFELKETKETHNPMIVITLKVLEGEYEGRKDWMNLVLLDGKHDGFLMKRAIETLTQLQPSMPVVFEDGKQFEKLVEDIGNEVTDTDYIVRVTKKGKYRNHEFLEAL